MNELFTQEEGAEISNFDALEMRLQANMMCFSENGVSSESFAWEAVQQQWGVNTVYDVLPSDDEG